VGCEVKKKNYIEEEREADNTYIWGVNRDALRLSATKKL